jgi:CheY-like chemotaxis protein
MPTLLRILVVEDNPTLSELLCEMLALLGHEARRAATAEEGIAVLDALLFDVLLADINLAGASGIELAKIALQKIPSIKIIFASGYGFLVSDKTDFDFFLLPKPYALTQLKYALEAVSGTVAPDLSSLA